MHLHVSKRQGLISQSEIRAMTSECARLGGINLAQGVCDLEVPVEVREGAHKAIEDGINVYTRYDGLPALRQAIARKHEAQTGIPVDPETQIVASAGSTGIFHCVVLALLDPGDEVIVFEPFYSYHIATLQAAGVTPVFVRMEPPRWDITTGEIEKAVSPRTRAIILNTPSNPSGKVFSREEIEAVAGIARDRNLFVFTDEMYEHFVYGGVQHLSPVVVEGMADRTITTSGFSKIFSITGWRIGYCVCDEKWAQAIGHLNDLIYVCAPAPLQMGVVSGLNSLGRGYYDSVAGQYERKRDRICEALSSAGLQPHIPQGAYYVLADMSIVPGSGARERALEFLRSTGVASVPGSAFYHDHAGDHLCRFCFAKDDAVLDEACRKIADYRA